MSPFKRKKVYGRESYQHVNGQQERQALIAAAHTFAQFSHLGYVTTESLAYVYENLSFQKKCAHS